MSPIKNLGKALGVIFINLLVFVSISLAAYLGWLRLRNQTIPVFAAGSENSLTTSNQPVAPETKEEQIALPPLPQTNSSHNISRHATYFTIVPDRPSTDVLTYTVKSGDPLFTIAEKFNLQPATLLWG
ncbi:MAG: LysM peptidoglycan-binding domain-containing protein, partial [Anaerolineales bacterium]|nr:LysM peptidoglycan-binding domain-containing protein [Anaerolineales bacterium]